MKNYVKPSVEVVKLRQEEGIACIGSNDGGGKHGGKPGDKHPGDKHPGGGIKLHFPSPFC